MYGIFTNICPKNHPNVGKYTIHGAYGYSNCHHLAFLKDTQHHRWHLPGPPLRDASAAPNTCGEASKQRKIISKSFPQVTELRNAWPATLQISQVMVC